MPMLSKDAGRYLAYSQIGFEMVGPIVIGLLLDHYLQWSPWGVIVGAVLGFVVGLTQLLRLVNKKKESKSSSSQSNTS